MTTHSQVTLDDALARRVVPGTGWIAGYPRSGNALVRNILARCFGHVTLSFYPEGSQGAMYAQAVGGWRPCEGHVTLEMMEAAANRQGVLFVKTHELSGQPSDAPTIVIVRDPRRTLGSLRAWLESTGQGRFSFSDLIRGRHRWGNWSDWVLSWAQSAPRRDSLWLRYGDLCADPIRNGAERIAERFGLAIQGTGVDDFNRLRESDPVVFRKRDLSGNGGMSTEEERLCWETHGAVASMLGYYPGGAE